ncbi:MAG: transposase [Verrucomicrobiales bacterium]|nr:transposase [Verrucomicrobiales bacterium]
MRQARLRGEGHHFVHCISRIVQRQFLIKDAEKEKLRDLMLNQAGFAGLNVVTLAILDNHFHILIEVPDPDEVPELTVDDLFSRLPFIYSEAKIRELKKLFDETAARGDQDGIDRLLAGFAKRMHDTSFFMKEVKQRKHQNKGI